MTDILVVEDDPALLRALSMNLTARGYGVVAVPDGSAALESFQSQRPDVIVLDLGLPDISGLQVIRTVRAQHATPIVVLSARAESRDKIQALDLGADDYVTKPFNIAELLARLRAVVRRTAGEEPAVGQIGDVQIDLDGMLATRSDGTEVHLTPTEWRMLDTLMRRPGRLVPGDVLLTALRGSAEYTDPSYLRIYVAHLRQKLEPDPARPRHLRTEPGMGYRFQP